MSAATGLWRDEPRWLRIVADPRIFAIACAWLFVLTVVGTWVQRDIGLFQAVERYFTAWFIWLGSCPLPGGRLTLSVTGLNLLAVLFTRRSAHSPGLLILHAGTLLLLAGCMVGGAVRAEGSLALAEGETGGVMRSWNHHELAILVSGTPNDQLVTIGEGLLHPGATISHPALPVALTVVSRMTNSRSGQGGAIEPLPPDKEAERNSPGIILSLPDGRQIPLSASSGSAAIATDATAILRRRETPMPFSIELIKFTREDHPGTAMARRFSSEVMVHEAGSSRRVVISMNRPLRIGPWTLYQQSYGEAADGTVFSVLAVVRDRWQLSPYIASSIMLIGLLLHLVLRIRRVSLA